MKYQKTPGVTLIIAIIFVSAFMLVMAGLYESQLRVIQTLKNREQEGRARYAAESALELASKWAAENGTGANASEAPEVLSEMLIGMIEDLGFDGDKCRDMDGNPDNINDPCVGFEVIGSPRFPVSLGGQAGYSSVPEPGTGTAGSDCKPDSPAVDADDSCNWNKLVVGEAIEIPLYKDAAGSSHDFAAAGAEFILRVRAPKCSSLPGLPENCGIGDRADLYPLEGSPEYRDPKKDPVLIHWIISDFGENANMTLLANEKLVNGKRNMSQGNDLDNLQNTEISAGRINIAKDPQDIGGDLDNKDTLDNFIILKYISNGIPEDKHRGKDINKIPQLLGDYISIMQKPVLRLTLVDIPQRNNANQFVAQDIEDKTLNIPFLEYQFLSKGVDISSEKSTLKAWAEIGDFRKEMIKFRKRKALPGGFVLESP